MGQARAVAIASRAAFTRVGEPNVAVDSPMNTHLLVLVLVVILVVAAFRLGRLTRRRTPVMDMSPVTRQHIDLFQGGQLSESAVESAKQRLRALLERGETEAVEASLRPGMHYVINVRALTEIGTDDAGRILERQLRRRLSDDQVEQSWYWIDLASGLRHLHREQSLPHLLRCADAASDIPLGHFFAAETVCFMSFSGYLQEPDTPLGRAALRLLHRALEGLRHGVQPQVLAEGRLGELVEQLWDHRGDAVRPLVVRVFLESLRQIHRALHVERTVGEDRSELESIQWQLSRLVALEPVLADYLAEAGRHLVREMKTAPLSEHRDYLLALDDIRADAAAVLLPLLADPSYPHAELAVEVLVWSSDPQVGPTLRSRAVSRIPMDRRAMKRPCPEPPRRPSVPADVPYRAILHALRGHPSVESENFLVLAAADWDPKYRAAAVSSLGWWEPIDRPLVLGCLQAARRDCSIAVRHLARAALARLGERQALQWFRQSLVSENPHAVHEAIQTISSEGLTLLWPDLDSLADSVDSDIAYHAREALERFREDLDRRHHRW
jgi:hypothetical protein